MATTKLLMTAEELERMPGEDARCELVRGELVRMVPASHGHGRVAGTVHGRLSVFVAKEKLGWVYSAETGFLLARNPDTVRAPDIAFVTRERAAAQPRDEGFFQGAPDLAVEVVSPGDTLIEVEAKVLDYLQAGARLVWVLNPKAKTVTVYRSLTQVHILTAADVLDGEDVLPGFAVPVSELFE